MFGDRVRQGIRIGSWGSSRSCGMGYVRIGSLMKAPSFACGYSDH